MLSRRRITILCVLSVFLVLNVFAAPKKTPKSIVESFDEIAQKLLQTKADGKKASYAFVALSSDDGNAIAEDYVTDALTEAVFNTGKIKIFERANLEKILSEQKFQSSGLVDEDTAKDIGKIAGVDFICYGTLKNIGDSITVNVRVVDVQNGEICAMARATVDKDNYLKNVKFEARKTGNAVAEQKSTKETESNAVTNRAKAKAKADKSSWKTSVVRNDFDEETIYSFKCMNPDGAFIFFGYEKADKSINSRVRCSLSWSVFHANWNQLDFKVDTGDIFKINQKNTDWLDWDIKNGLNYEKKSNSTERIYKADISTSKTLFNMFCKNDAIYIRDLNGVYPFATEGFLDVLTANGITVDEIQKAFANESF